MQKRVLKEDATTFNLITLSTTTLSIKILSQTTEHKYAQYADIRMTVKYAIILFYYPEWHFALRRYTERRVTYKKLLCKGKE
jgi:hypothetical protein